VTYHTFIYVSLKNQMDSIGGHSCSGDNFESGFPHSLAEIHETWYERRTIGSHSNLVFFISFKGRKQYRERGNV